jgi:hypothetical protein
MLYSTQASLGQGVTHPHSVGPACSAEIPVLEFFFKSPLHIHKANISDILFRVNNFLFLGHNALINHKVHDV